MASTFERDLAHRLGRVGVEIDAVLAAEGADLRERLDDADLVVDRHRRDQQGLVRDGVVEAAEIDEAARRDRKHGEAEALGRHRLAALEHAFVLGSQGDDVAPALAGETGQPLDGEVVGLCRPRGEDDLARLGTDEGGDLAARALAGFLGRAPEGVGDRARVAEFLAEIGQHACEYARIDGGRRLVVEIDRQPGQVGTCVPQPGTRARSVFAHAAQSIRAQAALTPPGAPRRL